MGFRERETDSPATKTEVLFSWEVPNYRKAKKETVALTNEREITRDPLQNKKAVHMMILDIQRLIEDADQLNTVMGPETFIKGFDPVLDAWYDRNNLERLVEQTKLIMTGKVTPELITGATLLVTFYFNNSIKSFKNHLEIIDDMAGRMMVDRSRVIGLSNETREPETLEEVVCIERDIDTCDEVISGCRERVLQEKSKIITSLQAYRYIQDVSLG